MFAAGRNQQLDARDAAAATDADDWLSVGTSFVPEPRSHGDKRSDDRGGESSALRVYRKSDKKKHKKKKKKSSSRQSSERRRSSHKRSRRSDSSASDSSDSSARDCADDSQLVRYKERRMKKSKKSRPRRTHSDSSSDGDSDSHRRKDRKHKRLRATDEQSARAKKVDALVAASAPKEVQVWMKQAADSDQLGAAGGAKLFEFDCAGDRENRFYGSLYAQDKPLYSLATRRNLFTGEWLVDRKKAAPPGLQHSCEKADQTASRYFGASARQMEKDARQQRLYLAYSDKRIARQRESKVSGASGSELAYIPLDPVLDLSSVPVGASRDDDEEQLLLRTETANVEQYLVARSKLFNEALKTNPQDIAAWLDFIAFQEQSLRLTRRTSSSSSSAMVKDKQAAILEKAVDANPDSRELQRVKLNFAIRSLDSSSSNNGSTAVRRDHDTLRRRLEEMIEQDPTNGDLWSQLVAMRQQNFASFSMPSLRDLYARIIAVLRKETAKVVQEHAESATSVASKTSSSVQIFGSGSLLSASAPSSFATSYEGAMATSVKAQELAKLMLDFHLHMCVLERGAGYTERAVAQLQALVEFNLMNTTASGNGSSSFEHHHAEMLRAFAVVWDESKPHVGDDDNDSTGGGATATKLSLKSAFLPPESAFMSLVHERVISQLSSVNPPESIQSALHQQSLLTLAGAHHRTRGGSKGSSLDAKRGDDQDESDGDELSSGGKLTYSNVHGYRIKLDEIDDASEYERILSELRGTEASIAKQESQAKKREHRDTKVANSVAKFHDERADYDPIDGEDAHFAWLKQEEAKDATQWLPLRSANPEHQEMIAEAPDRAVLTEEIQPFLFRVPRALRLTAMLNLLECVGVQWLKQSEHRGKDVYADSLETEYDELVAPILSALDPRSAESIALSSYQRRGLLERGILDDVRVSKVTLWDPSKVAFVRNVLLRFLHILLRERDRESVRLVKYMWIAFEGQLVCHTEGSDREVGLQYARQLCQRLMENDAGDTSPDSASRPDVALMFAYAKLELRARNARQVNRICDKTLRSLELHSFSDAKVDRSFHALLFLRARNEAWGMLKSPTAAAAAVDPSMKSSSSEELGKLKALYVLWSEWLEHHEAWDSLEKLERAFRKQPAALEKQLKGMLSSSDVKTAVVEKYRLELEIATQQYLKQSSRGDVSVGVRSKPNEWLWSAGYCAHNLCLAIYVTSGFQAACSEYQSLLQEWGSSSEQHSRHNHRWLRLCYLEFVQQHQLSCGFPIVAPRDWRLAIGRAVEQFPHEPVLLRLYVDAEMSNPMSQSLRRHFQSARQRWQRHFDSPLVVEWLFALLCELSRLERSVAAASWQQSEGESSLSFPTTSERQTCCLFHKSGSNLTGVERIRRVFQDMIENVRTQGSALCWRLYVRFEVAMGKIDSARRVFYRGLAKCPWSKALYLDGIRVLRPYLSEAECKELVDFMAAKELHVRVEEEEEEDADDDE